MPRPPCQELPLGSLVQDHCNAHHKSLRQWMLLLLEHRYYQGNHVRGFPLPINSLVGIPSHWHTYRLLDEAEESHGQRLLLKCQLQELCSPREMSPWDEGEAFSPSMEVQNLPPLVPPQGGDRVWLLLQRITLKGPAPRRASGSRRERRESPYKPYTPREPSMCKSEGWRKDANRMYAYLLAQSDPNITAEEVERLITLVLDHMWRNRARWYWLKEDNPVEFSRLLNDLFQEVHNRHISRVGHLCEVDQAWKLVSPERS